MFSSPAIVRKLQILFQSWSICIFYQNKWKIKQWGISYLFQDKKMQSSSTLKKTKLSWKQVNCSTKDLTDSRTMVLSEYIIAEWKCFLHFFKVHLFESTLKQGSYNPFWNHRLRLPSQESHFILLHYIKHNRYSFVSTNLLKAKIK